MSKHFQPSGKTRWQDHVLPGRTRPKHQKATPTPGKPGKPGKPGRPGKPGKPGKAADPGKPGKPGQPLRVAKDRHEAIARDVAATATIGGHQRKVPSRSHLVKQGGQVAVRREPRVRMEAGAEGVSRRPAQLDGQGLAFITLAQFLKTLNVVGSGGEAKALIRAGGIRVNGTSEQRPARKLHHADTVLFAGSTHTVELPTPA